MIAETRILRVDWYDIFEGLKYVEPKINTAQWGIDMVGGEAASLFALLSLFVLIMNCWQGAAMFWIMSALTTIGFVIAHKVDLPWDDVNKHWDVCLSYAVKKAGERWQLENRYTHTARQDFDMMKVDGKVVQTEEIA